MKIQTFGFVSKNNFRRENSNIFFSLLRSQCCKTETFCTDFQPLCFSIFYDLQPTWTSGKVLAALDSPGLVKALRSMMTTSKRFWHLSRRNAQTLKTKFMMMKNDEEKKYWGKWKPITYHETTKLTFMKTEVWWLQFDEKNEEIWNVLKSRENATILRYLALDNLIWREKMAKIILLKNSWKRSGFALFGCWQL